MHQRFKKVLEEEQGAFSQVLEMEKQGRSKCNTKPNSHKGLKNSNYKYNYI